MSQFASIFATQNSLCVAVCVDSCDAKFPSIVVSQFASIFATFPSARIDLSNKFFRVVNRFSTGLSTVFFEINHLDDAGRASARAALHGNQLIFRQFFTRAQHRIFWTGRGSRIDAVVLTGISSGNRRALKRPKSSTQSACALAESGFFPLKAVKTVHLKDEIDLHGNLPCMKRACGAFAPLPVKCISAQSRSRRSVRRFPAPARTRSLESPSRWRPPSGDTAFANFPHTVKPCLVAERIFFF